jgi:serine/threonine protein kinase
VIGARRYRPGSAVRVAGLEARYLCCLKRDFFAVNHLVEAEGVGRFVVKASRLIPHLARRERAVYRRLAGVEGVPRLVPPQAESWLAHEYLEGRTLAAIWEDIARDREARPAEAPDPRVPPDFYERLESLVRACHARSVIVLDLAKRDNILVRPDGRPALVDFQISLRFPTRRGRLLDRAFRALARADLYQVFKHRRRHGFARGEKELRAGLEVSRLHRLHHRFLRDPWLFFRRRFLPSNW